ncbi:MAG: hypothetical protein ACOC3H_01820 [bacterium]
MGDESSNRRSLGLWIAAGLLLATAVVLYFTGPSRGREPGRAHDLSEIESTIAKAATYYEFGHYERAAETYTTAIERGMTSGIEWYRYAHSIELTRGPDLDAYLAAYRLLLEGAPDHEYTARTAALLDAYAESLVYEDAAANAYETGVLVQVGGTVSRVAWGRVEADTSTLFVATRPDDWLGHLGDEVAVETAGRRSFQAGDRVHAFGWYGGWERLPDGAGGGRDYPVVAAAVVSARVNSARDE